MTTLPLFGNLDEPTTLPLIVASRWNFPLAYHRTDNGMMYAIQDWMRGLTGDEDVSKILAKFKKQDMWQ